MPDTPNVTEETWIDERLDANEDPLSIRLGIESMPGYLKDPWFYRMIVLFGGFALLTAAIGMIVLAFNNKELPEGLVAIASGIIGMFSGIFASNYAKGNK